MTQHNYITFEEAVLWRALDDWVSDAEVIGLVRRSGLVDPGSLRDLAVGLVARLVASELVVLGEVASDGFRPWESSPGDSIIRMCQGWARATGPFVRQGDIFLAGCHADGGGGRISGSGPPGVTALLVRI